METPENRPNYAAGTNLVSGARLPIPGNAEWLLWAVMAIVVAIVVLASDNVNSATWVDYMKWTTAAYLIARGIAKASRVLEQ